MILSRDIYDYESEQAKLLAVGFTLSGLTTILMLLRVYVRLRISSSGTAALLWALIAWLFTFSAQVACIFAVKYGLGKHITDVEIHGNIEKYLLTTWILIFLFQVDIPLGKVAAASFLLAVHAQAHPKRRYLLHFIAYSNVIVAIPNWFLIWFHCNPPRALWNPLEQRDCRVSLQVNYAIFGGVWAALSDFVLAIIPIFLIGPLQMKMPVKVGLCFLMGLGVIAGGCTIVRTVFVPQVASGDISYSMGQLVTWAEAEEWLVLIATSVPPLWPLFRPIATKALSISRYSTRKRDFQPAPDSTGLQRPDKCHRVAEDSSSRFGGEIAMRPMNGPREMEKGRVLEERRYFQF